MSPARRRDAVNYLAKRMNELAEENPRYGYRRIHALLNAEGWGVNRKRIERLWRLEGHRIPATKRPQGQKARGSDSSAMWNLPATGLNHVWSYDFVATRSESGSAIRIVNVVDEFTRRSVAVKVERHIGTPGVIECLEEAFEKHGRPQIIRSDNGREFIAATLADWLESEGVVQAFIEKGSPQQNAFVERFNGSMRDEVLNGEIFRSVLEVDSLGQPRFPDPPSM
ncbi:MAG: IS3 family transposase [Solirubrobacterales bacterium]